MRERRPFQRVCLATLLALPLGELHAKAIDAPDVAHPSSPAIIGTPPKPSEIIETVDPDLPIPELAERSHEILSREIVDVAQRLDAFFATDRSYQESKGSFIQYAMGPVMRNGGSVGYEGLTRVKVSMPNAEHRFSLLIESDPVRTKDNASILSATENADYSAAARLAVQKGMWHTNLDTGIRLNPLEPFAKLRTARDIPLDSWNLHLSESLFWYQTTSGGLSVQGDLERPFGERLFFRSASVTAWKIQLDGFEFGETLQLYHKIGERNSLLYEVGAEGKSRPFIRGTLYGATVRYRHRLYRNWLYAEVAPSLVGREENGYMTEATLALRLEATFGSAPEEQSFIPVQPQKSETIKVDTDGEQPATP